MSEESNHKIDQETREMLSSFVSEAFDSLDTNEPIVEDLRAEDNSESVNAIFRVFHTLKGLSGFFDMRIINKVTHEAETLLDIMRRQNRKQSEDTITVIYQTFDFLRSLLERVSMEFTDQSGAEEAEDMILIIRDALDTVKNSSDLAFVQAEQRQSTVAETTDIDASPVEMSEEFSLDANKDFKEESRQASIEQPLESSTQDLLLGDEMFQQYLNDANELVDIAESNLIELEHSPDNEKLVLDTFGAIHSLKGNSGFMGFSIVEEVAMEMETILDSIRKKDLDVEEMIITVLLSNIGSLRNRLSEIALTGGNQQRPDDVFELKVDEPQQSISSEDYDIQAKKIGHLDGEHSYESSKHETPDAIAIESKPTEQKSIEPSSPGTQTKQIKPPKEKETQQTAATLPQMQKKDIRVETSKIDRLFDMVGELITIETMVTRNPDLRGLDLPNFAKSANMLNKITRDLQEISMSIRMMPLEGLFNKMKRLVRDVTIKMGKKVNLLVSGQETEMDKNVIDEISDPLVHILRNAIDHGVESPTDRREKGKPEEGTVKLSAAYEGNEIIISVEDDGAGMSREALIRKAEEKGILRTEPENMSDKEVFLLIFEAGFLTAKEVTDISGRGVGMDVVRKNIEKLRGSVDIQSQYGKGSKITLRIPLTLAIMEAMIIRLGEEIYALPILAIRESFRPSAEAITVTMDGLEVVKVREEILPVIRLHEVFNEEADSVDLSSGILIIVEAGERKACLFADEIVGQQQAVIKALSNYIGKVEGITGCMVLGDGGIGLILDIEGLINMAEHPKLFQPA